MHRHRSDYATTQACFDLVNNCFSSFTAELKLTVPPSCFQIIHPARIELRWEGCTIEYRDCKCEEMSASIAVVIFDKPLRGSFVCALTLAHLQIDATLTFNTLAARRMLPRYS